MAKKAKQFPCPFCKGQGSWQEFRLDDGSGPTSFCGFCNGDAMLDINGKLHKELIKMKKEREQSYLIKRYCRISYEH